MIASVKPRHWVIHIISAVKWLKITQLVPNGCYWQTGAIAKTEKNKQVLDKLQVERERGITVKAQTASLFYSHQGQQYLLNLIDTPVSAQLGVICDVWKRNYFLFSQFVVTVAMSSQQIYVFHNGGNTITENTIKSRWFPIYSYW